MVRCVATISLNSNKSCSWRRTLHLLSTVNCQLSTVNCQLSTVNSSFIYRCAENPKLAQT
ncbi:MULTISPECIES: hypothetical protein [unclassified Microcoleus]|uniref:hypothetical protein n=1 Tax=unclassified Microcoleus TaxID=2642155 RepID=UPI0025F1BDE1|nr:MULTISPECIES: hypothetical protein [unclassified Microcoleus]